MTWKRMPLLTLGAAFLMGASLLGPAPAVSLVSTAQAADVTPPTLTVIDPARNSVQGSSVTVRGEARDESGVDDVSVAVQRTSDGYWLESNGSWSASFARTYSGVRDDGTWVRPLPELGTGAYAMSVEVFDLAGNVAKVYRPFSVSAPQVDTPPNVTITNPATQTRIPSSGIASGTASDDHGITTVEVSVVRPDFDNGYEVFTTQATLSHPGALETAWEVAYEDLQSPRGGGSTCGCLMFIVTATDTSGHTQVANAEVYADGTTIAPQIDVVTPTRGQVVSASGTLTGYAIDPELVRWVKVAIYDRSSPDAPWLQPDGSFGATFAFRYATLFPPGEEAVRWSLDYDLPPGGSYGVVVRAADELGNKTTTPGWVGFATHP